MSKFGILILRQLKRMSGDVCNNPKSATRGKNVLWPIHHIIGKWRTLDLHLLGYMQAWKNQPFNYYFKGKMKQWSTIMSTRNLNRFYYAPVSSSWEHVPKIGRGRVSLCLVILSRYSVSYRWTQRLTRGLVTWWSAIIMILLCVDKYKSLINNLCTL
jgi:hypothetical protein